MSGILTFLHRSQAEIPRSEYLNIFSGERITPLANSSTEIVEAPWVERGGLDPLARSHQHHPRDTTDANQGANKAGGRVTFCVTPTSCSDSTEKLNGVGLCGCWTCQYIL